MHAAMMAKMEGEIQGSEARKQYGAQSQRNSHHYTINSPSYLELPEPTDVQPSAAILRPLSIGIYILDESRSSVR